jgi:hypothetical protein
MRVACLIQGDSWVALNNLLAPDNGVSNLTADLADQNVSPKIGDAILVIDGEEFAVHVVALIESGIIFEADRSNEIAEKLSSTPGAEQEGPVNTSVSPGESSNDFLKTPTQNDELETYEHHTALSF